MYSETFKGLEKWYLGSIKMGYDIYPKLPGLKLATCSSQLQFPWHMPADTTECMTVHSLVKAVTINQPNASPS